MDKKTSLWIAGILAGALFFGLWLLGGQIAASRGSDVITVTGSTKRRVTADMAKWIATFSRRAHLGNVKTVLDQIKNDEGQITTFAVAEGLKLENITFTSAQTEPIYEQIAGYGQNQTIIGYLVKQEVKIESADIELVEKLAKNIGRLVERGVITDYQRTEYYYTKLFELRPDLFAEATQDALKRAEAIVDGAARGGQAGAGVGKLRSARTGVIQILPPNSTEVADYGAYDLSTREKDITATVNVSFAVK